MIATEGVTASTIAVGQRVTLSDEPCRVLDVQRRRPAPQGGHTATVVLCSTRTARVEVVKMRPGHALPLLGGAQ